MMRTGMLTVGVLVIASAAKADDVAAVVDKAIQAIATSELRLQRLANVVRVERGTFFLATGDLALERTSFCAPPDRIKHDATITDAGRKQTLTMSLNGQLAWQQKVGQIEDLTAAAADGLAGDLDGWALITLRPLRERGAKLRLLPDATINGKKAVGVNLTRAGRPDAQFYFDVGTGVPLRITFKLRGGAETRQQDLDGYKDFDGIRLPTKITVMHNGQKSEEWTVLNYKFPDRFDVKLFEKPK